MKKYIKYKDFLPTNYINENIKRDKNSNKKAFGLLIILNAYMLSSNLSNILNKEELNTNINYSYDNTTKKYTSEIEEWLELKKLNIESLEASNKEGIINVLNKDILCDIENKGYDIINITLDNSIYKAKVVRNE